MKATVITIQFESTSTILATVKGMLEAMNIKYGEKSYEWEDAPKVETPKAKSAPKKSEKKSGTSKKSTSKKSAGKKSSDNFDYDEYKALSEHFMVYGKNGCYRFARKTIYGIMGKGYVVNGEVKMTKRTVNSVLKTLTSEAEKCGEAWATEKMAEIKKAMA